MSEIKTLRFAEVYGNHIANEDELQIAFEGGRMSGEEFEAAWKEESQIFRTHLNHTLKYKGPSDNNETL